MKRYHLTTFGCQMNEHDSERMKGMLESLGYTEAPERCEADLILFNTCSIRESADSRFIAHLGEAKRLKRERPERVVGVGGCWAQSVKEEVFERFPFVDVAFGPGQVHKLAEFLTSDSLTAQGYFEFEGFTGHLPARRARARSRGGCRSAWAATARARTASCPRRAGARSAARRRSWWRRLRRWPREGVREVTLLGQNVNSYGRDLRPERATFAELLRADRRDRGDRAHPLHEPPPEGHARGRDPRARGACERVRAHPPAAAVRLEPDPEGDAAHLRPRALPGPGRADPRARPDAALTTDIIVGFPGETEEDFAQTLEVVEEVGYDSAFTFIFSPRRGTEAAEMTEGVVPHPVKVERMEG